MIAVLGATGQLGTAFMAHLGDSAIGVRRPDLDLRELDSIEPWVEKTQPQTIINCAGFTAVDDAESDPESARVINALAVGELGRAAGLHHVRLVTFSTDYVFDGKKVGGYVESDEPNPINVYGRTKLEGERLALKAHPKALVVRTSWLLSATHRNFLTTMLELLEKGEVLVVADQRGRPTFVEDLVVGTIEAMESKASGLLHLTNQGDTTWYQLAREIADAAGYDTELVKPTSSSELDRRARRPSNSILNSERLVGLGIAPLPPGRDSLVATVARLRATGRS